MNRSPSILIAIALASMIGCFHATGPTPPEPPAIYGEPVWIQMCTPGTEFAIGADYLVVKADSQEPVFTKLVYECVDHNGIDFQEVSLTERVKTEACHSFRIPSHYDLPQVLYMHDDGPLPVIYTRTTMEETVQNVFRNNPCEDECADDSNTTAMLE